MAGDWIKMRADLHTHPKVVRISSALKADRLRIVGGLHAVWCLFDAHSEDGSLSGYTLDAIDELIGFAGFSEAMCKVDWLSADPDGVALPEFDEHNGQSAKRRATETQRKRREREEEAAEAARTASASDADKKRSREEKRREDKSPSLRSGDAAAQAALLADLPAKLAADFLKLRKAKKLPLTETALDGIKAEALKANLTLEQALTECCHRGWAGFKASWDRSDKGIRVPGGAQASNPHDLTGKDYSKTGDFQSFDLGSDDGGDHAPVH
jgi:hypothetical protein